MTTFNELQLSPEILKSLAGLGYDEATEVQAQVIPAILNQKDVLVQSKTGSGKTAAFGIPLCEQIEWEENKPQVLILTPTRELAVQVQEEIMHIGRFKRLKVAAVYGKAPFKDQARELKQKTHIVVGTPGRVLDHIERGTLNLQKIKCVVLDEADEMLKMGFIETVEMIIKMTPSTCQMMLFSATMPNRIKELAQNYLTQPIEIKIESEHVTTELVEHELYPVRMQEKVRLLQDLLTVQNPERCIIFCSTREAVDALYQGLKAKGYPVNRLHGGLEQKDRLDIMRQFKMGRFAYLVATDVAARGIDVSGMTHVFNFDLPEEKDAFVHRIGRAGRAGEKGKAITFVTPFETKWLEEIQNYIGFELPVAERPVATEVEKSRAAFEAKLKAKPKMRMEKRADVNREIMKIYLNGGKKKKLRAIDFVGTILSIEGIEKEDIGIIDIQENVTYIDILNGKGWSVIDGLKTKTIKGKKLKVQKAYN
ncbi:DEAD/DEAH box helicase [Turicibacter bilis]|uniref:DEAD/DEAH box helicase n=1 Tax=Turicibacter bilis TaxID=2735723 RepID=UPI003F8B3D4B